MPRLFALDRNGEYSAVSGGNANEASTIASTVGGGEANHASGLNAVMWVGAGCHAAIIAEVS